LKLWKFLLLVIGMVIFGGVAVLGVNFLVLPGLIHQNKVVIMPDIRGMTPTGAQTQLRSLELEVVVSRQLSHPTIPEDMILDQIPAPEKGIRGGRTVMVITSSGPPAGALPELTGLSLRQAEITLQRENYRLGRVLHIRRTGVTEPMVDFQSPESGLKLYKGAVVDLVVAEPQASELVRMPDLRGTQLFKARQIVADAGFVLAPVSYQRTNDVPPNLVLEQQPPAGKRIPKGERLELVASSR
jgi:eukaryotic-like serine/threonine-protein kinase